MIYKFLYRRAEKRRGKANGRLKTKTTEAQRYRRQWLETRSELTAAKKRIHELEDGYVVEWCDYCHRQVTMLWDVKADGLTAFCPFCSAKMMLCQQCGGECDYDYGLDLCKEM